VLVHGRVQSSAACVHATFRPSIFFLQGLWSNLRMELSHQINDGARLGGHSLNWHMTIFADIANPAC
jgi:hypothetical protein